MSKITISKEEFDVMAQRIHLPLVESTYEETRATVETCLNNAAIFQERFSSDEKYRDIFFCFSVNK